MWTRQSIWEGGRFERMSSSPWSPDPGWGGRHGSRTPGRAQPGCLRRKEGLIYEGGRAVLSSPWTGRGGGRGGASTLSASTRLCVVKVAGASGWPRAEQSPSETPAWKAVEENSSPHRPRRPPCSGPWAGLSLQPRGKEPFSPSFPPVLLYFNWGMIYEQ